MALRLAQRQREFQKLTRRKYTTSIREARFTSSKGAALSLHFGPGLTVLCGLNGAGKSSTLAALWHSLSGGLHAPGHLPKLPEWLTRVDINGSTGGEDWDVSYNFDTRQGATSELSDVVVDYLDPSAETEAILNYYRADDNLDDLTEGLDPTHFSDELRALLSFVVGREYEDIAVYEVTSFSEDDLPIPFFVARCKGVEYNLLRMGRGEINATYMLWKLNGYSPGSIVLLEEPESHLAQLSQDSLIDALVSLIVKRDLTIITSSHAPEFFRRLPDSHTTLLASLPVPSVISGLPTAELADLLGVPKESGPLLVTEDSVASAMLKALLLELTSSSLKNAPIRYASSGESGVSRVIDELTDRGRYDGRVVAVYDGDQREVLGGHQHFLIGDSSPERVLRSAVKRWQSGELQNWQLGALGDPIRFGVLLHRFDGLEDHDWLMELAKRYSGVEVIVHSFTKLILLDPEHRMQAQELVDSLERSTSVK